MFFGKKTAAEETTTRRNPQIFPSVHESELSERNKNRGRCNFFSVFAKEGEGNQPVVLRSPAGRVVCHFHVILYFWCVSPLTIASFSLKIYSHQSIFYFDRRIGGLASVGPLLNQKDLCC